MLKFWADSGDWANKTFGGPEVRGPLGPLKHIVKECKEIQSLVERIEQPLLGENNNAPTIDEIAEELFDLQHLIFDTARRLNMTFSAFVTGLNEKLEINKQREWPRNPLDTNEPIEHKRDE